MRGKKREKGSCVVALFVVELQANPSWNLLSFFCGEGNPTKTFCGQAADVIVRRDPK